VLDAAIILCGNCSPPSVRLAKVVLTGNTNDIISRNVKKDRAVKYPIRRVVSTLKDLLLNIIENIKFYK
jgi:hypothetical protein